MARALDFDHTGTRQREKGHRCPKGIARATQAPHESAFDEAARQYIEAVSEDRHDKWEPKDFGFEFSLEQVEVRAIELKPDLFADYYASLNEAA